MRLFFFLSVLIIAAGCRNAQSPQANAGKASGLPAPGTLLAADSIRVSEEVLNKTWFSIRIKADSMVQRGVYDVTAAYGFDTAASTFTMPKGGEQLVPVLKRGAMPYSYTIGFRMEDDTAFYEYFGVTGAKGSIEMKYLKGYSFEQEK